MKQLGHRQETVCSKVMEYIQNNYSDHQLSVMKLGDELKLSPYYVSKLFKEKYELTVSDFVAKTRIENVKEQLRSTDMSVKAIAEKNGFLSSHSLIRTYKRWEGMTPGAYRRQEKGNSILDCEVKL